MNRRHFLKGATIISVSIWAGCTDKKSEPTKTSTVGLNSEGYWTCTMHPQVHQEAPGKCPICGMPLVHVNGQGKLESKAKEPEGLEASNTQLQNAQISRYTVAKKDLEIAIPVSGRLLSSREVAFQIYESDLTSVKPGYEFSGSPTGNPGLSLNGKITSVDTIVDPSSRTIRVVGVLQSSSQVPSTETGFHGEIRNTLKNQIVVPEDAVLQSGTRDLVYVFTADNKLTQREVQLGQKGKQGYQVLSGLKEGEVISSGPNFLIDSEAKIRGQ